MKLLAFELIAVLLLLPAVCFAQNQNPAAAPTEPPKKVQVRPAPVDCKRSQSWSQTEERCVTVVTCEKTKKPWAFRCLLDGEYKKSDLQALYKRGFRLTEITPKGAYYFKDVR